MLLLLGATRSEAKTLRVNFGNEVVLPPNGQSSAPQKFTIQNNTSSQFTVQSITVPDNAFQIQPNSCITTYQPGNSCVFAVIFTPTVPGKHTATLTALTDVGSFVATLIGQAKLGTVTLAPKSLSFGKLETGQHSAKTLTVTNPNIIPFPAASIALSGSGFSIASNSCGAAVMPGHACSVTVSFVLYSRASSKGALIFSDTALKKALTLNLTGVAIGSPVASPTATATATATSTPTGTATATVTPTATKNATPTVTATVTATPTSTPTSTLKLYVTNVSPCANVGVLAFPIAGDGNINPLAPKPQTGLASPSGIARDPKTGNLYVANSCNSTITVYAPTANGNAAPIATLGGDNTGLNLPGGIALDSDANIYVTNTNGNSVTVYSAGASGNASPSATISGLDSQISSPAGIALDSAGNIYVANSATNVVAVFSHGSNGNVVPSSLIRGFDTQLNDPVGIALDANGNIFVTNLSSGGPNSTVTAYSPLSNGNVAPMTSITGLYGPSALAIDPNGNIYVADSHFSVIFVYPPGSNGNAIPSAEIQGSDSGLNVPIGITLDSKNNIYAVNKGNSVTIYPAGSDGTVTPSTVIASGPSAPIGIALDAAGNIYVSDSSALFGFTDPGRIFIYPPDSNATTAPTGTISALAQFLAGLAADPSGDIWVANVGESIVGGSILYFPAGSTGGDPPGDAEFGSSLQSPVGIGIDSNKNVYVANTQANSIQAYAPISPGNWILVATISGSNTGIATPVGVALDANANIYVSNPNVNTITVYSAGSSGNVPPIAVLTNVPNPNGIALDSEGNIYVANGSGSIRMYPAGSNGSVAPQRTISGPNTGLSFPFGLAIGP